MSWHTAHADPIVRSLQNPAIATPSAKTHMFWFIAPASATP